MAAKGQGMRAMACRAAALSCWTFGVWVLLTWTRACLFQLLLGALTGAALTADIIDLFVWFEVAARSP